MNGIPYVLRDQFLTLRNTKSYSGINAERLEILEMKLKEDLCDELDIYNGKILLHSETSNGEIVPLWENIEKDAVLTLAEVMAALKAETGTTENTLIGAPAEDFYIKYFRAPMTSETAPWYVLA